MCVCVCYVTKHDFVVHYTQQKYVYVVYRILCIQDFFLSLGQYSILGEYLV